MPLRPLITLESDKIMLENAANLRQGSRMKPLPRPQIPGNWVQTEREAHESWAALLRKSPRAAELLHLLTARVGQHNAVVISQKDLARLMERSLDTVQRATKELVSGRWIEIRQIGDRGTVNAYVLNDRVVWSGPRDGIRYSLFSAAVVVSDQEQPDAHELGKQGPLRRLPSLYANEQQLPSGPGLPPPSQPSLIGLEPDLPAIEPGPEPQILEKLKFVRRPRPARGTS